MQMVDVELPTTDGRTIVFSRYTEPEADQAILLQQLKLSLPAQPPPRIGVRHGSMRQPAAVEVTATGGQIMDQSQSFKPEGAPACAQTADAGAPSGGAGPERRFSARRKLAVVTRLLRGEPLETVARELNVTVARLSAWRDHALVGAEAAMKERERDGRDEELLRLRAKLGEVTMVNELLEQKIAALEGGRPLARRRLRR
jgi:transposase